MAGPSVDCRYRRRLPYQMDLPCMRTHPASGTNTMASVVKTGASPIRVTHILHWSAVLRQLDVLLWLLWRVSRDWRIIKPERVRMTLGERPFATDLLDAAIRDRAQRLETERADLLERVSRIIREHAADLGIRAAYVVGSLARQHGWSAQSDVDLAISGGDVLAVMRLLEDISRRPADVIDLDRHPLPQIFTRTGILIVG